MSRGHRLGQRPEAVARGLGRHDPGLPFEVVGPGGVERLADALLPAIPDMRLDIEDVLAEGEKVLVRFWIRGHKKGELFGIRATGRPVQLRGVDFFEIEDGLIRRNTVFYDGATFARQIGMLPPQGSLPDRVVLRLFNLKTRITRPFRR